MKIGEIVKIGEVDIKIYFKIDIFVILLMSATRILTTQFTIG